MLKVMYGFQNHTAAQLKKGNCTYVRWLVEYDKVWRLRCGRHGLDATTNTCK
jgi:hypothetical protein